MFLTVHRLNSDSVPQRFQHLLHSALVLKTFDGKERVLEYALNGKVYLYDAKYKITGKCPAGSSGGDCYYIKMRDGLGEEWDWMLQTSGQRLPVWLETSPQAARGKMEQMMGDVYDPIKNNCHMAQERMRKSWGLNVDTTTSNGNEFCSG